MNEAMLNLPRAERRKLLSEERKRRKTGNWGSRERIVVGEEAGKGWIRQVNAAFRNRVFAVLVRDLPNGVRHMAVSSLSGDRPTWHEMQRIKNELAGRERTAVEVYPPAHEVVDGADMFHIWVLPGNLPFSLFAVRENGRAETVRENKPDNECGTKCGAYAADAEICQ